MRKSVDHSRGDYVDQFDTIIIGSGIGGLALGAPLVTKEPAHKVLILEKNSGLGGAGQRRSNKSPHQDSTGATQ